MGLVSISGLGSFLAAESFGTSGLDRLRGGAERVRPLWVPPRDHLAAVPKSMWTREPHKVHHSDAKEARQASQLPVLRECVRPIGAVQDKVGNQDRD